MITLHKTCLFYLLTLQRHEQECFGQIQMYCKSKFAAGFLASISDSGNIESTVLVLRMSTSRVILVEGQQSAALSSKAVHPILAPRIGTFPSTGS